MFGGTPRIVLASLVAYFCGEFCNSYVLAKMKLRTSGRMLWSRTIGSTIVGEAVDSLVFYPLAFYGVWQPELVLRVMLTNYTLKVLWEVVMTPVTYQVVNFLKRAESRGLLRPRTDFTPFSIADGLQENEPGESSMHLWDWHQRASRSGSMPLPSSNVAPTAPTTAWARDRPRRACIR